MFIEIGGKSGECGGPASLVKKSRTERVQSCKIKLMGQVKRGLWLIFGFNLYKKSLTEWV